MKKVKGEKVVNDKTDNSGLYGCMKGQIKIHGDIFSTGAWPTDEEMIQSYNEHAADTEAVAEALKRPEALVGDFSREPWDDALLSRDLKTK